MRAVTLLIVAVVALACDDMKALFTLQRAIAEEFGESPSLNIRNGRVLTVTFENSPSAALDDAALRERAHSVARFARTHHPRAEQLTTVTVVFENVDRTGPVTVTRTRGEFTWQLGELRAVDADDSTTARPGTP